MRHAKVFILNVVHKRLIC